MKEKLLKEIKTQLSSDYKSNVPERMEGSTMYLSKDFFIYTKSLVYKFKKYGEEMI